MMVGELMNTTLGSTVDQTEAASRGIFFGMRIVVVLQRVLQPKLF